MSGNEAPRLGSADAIKAWEADLELTLEQTQALAFIDRMFPEPEEGDNRALFNKPIQVEPELRQRVIEVDRDVLARINGSCVAGIDAEISLRGEGDGRVNVLHGPSYDGGPLQVTVAEDAESPTEAETMELLEITDYDPRNGSPVRLVESAIGPIILPVFFRHPQ